MRNDQFTEISFYIVAHADDWQIFMQPNAYHDLVAQGSKVIFIITTAGDAGFNESFCGSREEGLKSSLRLCLAPLAALAETSGTREFYNHTINYCTINNATCYFFRLPDGNLDGSGFPAYHYQSLSGFKEGQISAITAIDNSATYNNWSDFYITLNTIIQSESYGISNIWINYVNPDAHANPNDHPDHIATGQAIQNMSVITGFHQALFVGYNVSNTLENLHPTELFWKAAMFAVYEKAVFDGCGYSTLKEGIPTYLRWCLSSANFIITNP